MQTVYLWDESGIYFARREVDESGELPERSTFTEPPGLEEGQVAVWAAGVWGVLDERPVIASVVDVAGNERQRDSLLALAAIRIAPLQDAVDLDDASDEEVALLKKWKQYRVALNRIDTANPTWTEQPN